MDERPPEHTPEQILDTSTIQNIDTARMALRWALERLSKLEKEKQELLERAKNEERSKLKAQDEYSALQKTLSVRSSENDQRELYYAKLEEYLSLQLHGKLDVVKLAKRELDTAQLAELLDKKQTALEREYGARKSQLERDFERLREETERGAKAAVDRAERSAEAKRESLEQDHVLRLTELHERDAALKQAERNLAERTAHFEQYYAAQRAQLQSEVRNFKAEIDDQVQFRVQIAERLLEERANALQQGWTREKALLLRELETWRSKAQELGPRAVELERACALAEEAARQARAQADRQTIVLEEQRQAWQAERQLLQAELERWKGQAVGQLNELHSLREALAAAEERARQARAAQEAQAASFEESGKAWERERDTLAAEKQEWRARTDELLERNLELGKQAAVAEEAVLQTKGAAERQLAILEEKLKAAQAEAEAAGGDAAEARARAEAAVKKAQALECKLREAEEVIADAEADKTAREERLQRRVDELSGQREELKAELDEARRRSQEVLPRLLELEKSLSTTEESEDAVERHLLRFREQEKVWQRERAQLGEELAGLRGRLESANARALEAQRAAAAAREQAQEVAAAGERQAARFDERRAAWEAEKELLEADLSQLKKRLAAGQTRAEGEPPAGLA